MNAISEEYLNELKEAFSLFEDKVKTPNGGLIKTTQLPLVFKYLNQDHKDDEIKTMILEIDPEQTGSIDFPTFVILMTKQMRDNDTFEELLQSFRVFDPEATGTIAIPELRFILTQLGDKMTSDEVDDVIKDADSDGTGFIKYEPYIKEKLEKLEKQLKK